MNLFADDDRWVFAREYENAAVIVAINNADQPAEVRFPVPFPPGVQSDLLGGPVANIDSGMMTIRLNPQSAAIYR